MIGLLLLAAAQAATPMGGLEWRPLSRGDLTWIDDGRTTGLGVGEFDGLVHPALEGWGGAWVTDRVAFTLRLGIARVQNTTEVDKVVRQRHWGVVRPGLDIRWALMAPAERTPLPWLLVGSHATIPSVRDTSNGYTRAEQKAADEQASVDRAKLGGVGGRAGIGAEYPITPGVAIGGQWAATWHRSTWRADDVNTVSSWLGSDASVLISLRWPASRTD